MSTDPLEALLIEIQNVGKRRIKPALTWEALGQKIKDAKNGGKPLEDDYVTGGAPPLPVLPQEFPKLKVRYDYNKGGEALEWIVVNNGAEEADYHANGWYTAWPPNAPASVKQTQTIESIIEQLKSAGVKQRPKEYWEQRKQAAAKK